MGIDALANRTGWQHGRIHRAGVDALHGQSHGLVTRTESSCGHIDALANRTDGIIVRAWMLWPIGRNHRARTQTGKRGKFSGAERQLSPPTSPPLPERRHRSNTRKQPKRPGNLCACQQLTPRLLDTTACSLGKATQFEVAHRTIIGVFPHPP